MSTPRLRLGLSLLGLLSGACVAFGYDFGEYQAATGSAGESPMSGKARGPTEGFEPENSEGGAACLSPARASPTAHAGQPDVAGAAGAGDDSIFTTYAGGGAPAVDEAPGAGGVGGTGSAGLGGGGEGGSCEPRSCVDAQAKCGSIDDGCGTQLDCGDCFWWFEQCLENQCAILIK